MLTKEEAVRFAEDWVSAWNSHDLERIMAHYEEDVELTSPVAASLLKEPSGRVAGKKALREYFKKGLEAYPDLRFVLKDVMWGMASVVLYYGNQRGTRSGEYMEISPRGKVSKVTANYGS